jgi:hypothetical protein
MSSDRLQLKIVLPAEKCHFDVMSSIMVRAASTVNTVGFHWNEVFFCPSPVLVTSSLLICFFFSVLDV